ncbi:MAG TPA: TSUP family transporter [Solirubrobacteraceae bacterium]|nr:TSUP family transporter [Solirubrobacteraceae bacterium]
MVLAAFATFAGAALQSATGFGFALLLAPALIAVLGAHEAVGTVIVLSIAMNLLVLAGERRRPVVLAGPLGGLLAAALPGLAAGALLLAVISRAALQVVTGVAVLAAAAVAARRGRARRRAEPRGTTAAVGLLTGALTTATGVNGPPIVLWLQHRARSTAEIRDSLSAAFLVLNVLGIAAVVLLGGSGRAVGFVALAVLLPLVALGHALGRRVFVRLDPRRFRAAGLVLVAAAGLASLAGGLAGLA